MNVDVLVVGAGPTGLVLAMELVRHGVQTLVIDKEPEPTALSKAIVVHARTLEVLSAHGIAGTLVAAGVPLRRVQIFAGRDAGEAEPVPLVAVPFAPLPTAYPFLLSIPQARTEAIFADRLAALGGVVRRGVLLDGLVQDNDGVTATLSDGVVRARYVIGCDGAHSTVRRLVELPFRGASYPQCLIAGDVIWNTDLPRDALTSFLGEGFLACFPLPSDEGLLWRLIATVDEAPDVVTLAHLEEALTRVGQAGGLQDAGWLGSFRIHARQVDQYQLGRVYLAGDAAHIHSPAGGQGMNTGIQDAHNLGWKLAATLAGGPVALLDSYEAERYPIASQVLVATDALTRIGTARNPWLRAVRDRAAAALSGMALVRDRVTRAVSELDVAYRDSPIVFDRGPSSAVRAGDRLSDSAGFVGDPRHQVLLINGPETTPEGRRRLRLCEAFARSLSSSRVLVADEHPSKCGLREDGVLVVRPDGYIGLRLSPADPERFAEWFEHTLAM